MGWVLVHAGHLLLLVGLGGWFGAVRLVRARANCLSRDTVLFELSLDARLLLMACSVGAALVHAEVIRSHFQESTLYGWFFVLSAAAQLIWGLLVLRWPDRALLVSGAIGNGLIVVLWVVTRTTGLPIGPEPWQAESVGAFDVVATVLELALVIGSVALLAGTRGVRRSLPKYDSRETSRMLANLHAPAASTQNSAGRIGGLRHSGDERPATLVSGDRGPRPCPTTAVPDRRALHATDALELAVRHRRLGLLLGRAGWFLAGLDRGAFPFLHHDRVHRAVSGLAAVPLEHRLHGRQPRRGFRVEPEPDLQSQVR